MNDACILNILKMSQIVKFMSQTVKNVLLYLGNESLC